MGRDICDEWDTREEFCTREKNLTAEEKIMEKNRAWSTTRRNYLILLGRYGLFGLYM